MRFVQFIQLLLIVTLTQQVYAQCNNCDAINPNGDFELRVNKPGAAPDLGISAGIIENWQSSHGTADFFDSNWNWYYAEGIDNTAGHICYGNRPSHDHSEGIFTGVNVTNDSDLEYCLEFDLASFCDAENYGKLHIYFTNNVEQGSANQYSFPRPTTNEEWFQDSEIVDVILLDEDTYYNENGLSHFTIPVNPKGNYTQMWFFTEYLYQDEFFSSCGLMIDNVKLTAKTSALSNIRKEQIGNTEYVFDAGLTQPLDDLSYEWDFGNGQTSAEASPVMDFQEGLHTVTLKVKDARGACAEKSTELIVGNLSTSTVCDYSICLETGGVPSISSIELELPTGDLLKLDEKTEGFGFPYCVGSWSVCNSGEYELEYFILDLNNWFDKNGLQGRVIKNEDTVNDGCRADIFSIIETDIKFISLTLSNDNSDLEAEVIHFEIDNCFASENSQKTNNNKEAFETNMIDVYPNPVAEYLNVNFQENATSAEIKILNAQGSEISSTDLQEIQTGMVHRLSLENLGPGMYYIQVIANDKQESKQVMRI